MDPVGLEADGADRPAPGGPRTPLLRRGGDRPRARPRRVRRPGVGPARRAGPAGGVRVPGEGRGVQRALRAKRGDQRRRRGVGRGGGRRAREGRGGEGQPCGADQRPSFLKKSLPLSSTRMNAGKSTTSMRQTASMPSSAKSMHSTFLMFSSARIAAGPPIEPR